MTNMNRNSLKETSITANRLSTDYRRTLNDYALSLWSGELGLTDFTIAMYSLVNTGLYTAWLEGFAEYGIQADAILQDEWLSYYLAVNKERSYITRLAFFIFAHRGSEQYPASAIESRLNLWANRWLDIYNRARLLGAKDAPLTWVLGTAEKHCTDCIWAQGKTYRASIWRKYGWQTQSAALSCGGLNCDCHLEPASTPLTRGKPRRLGK